MKRVLLHICCGVCAAGAVLRLRSDGFYVEGFFSNSNIDCLKEHEKRSRAAQKVAGIQKIILHHSQYNPGAWDRQCSKYQDDKEGGMRCKLCYRMRLKESFSFAKEKGFDFFTTTLSISPHKRSADVFEIGKQVGGENFLPINFKEKDGFENTLVFAKKYKLYRQNYCG